MEISIVTKYVIDKFKENPLTNTIVIGKSSEIDTNKSNIYPLVNIDIIQAEILDNVHNGEIMLLHATSKDNSNILDEVIKDIKSMGYEFRSLDQFQR